LMNPADYASCSVLVAIKHIDDTFDTNKTAFIHDIIYSNRTFLSSTIQQYNHNRNICIHDLIEASNMISAFNINKTMQQIIDIQ
jgi:hypothetical protein